MEKRIIYKNYLEDMKKQGHFIIYGKEDKYPSLWRIACIHNKLAMLNNAD
jgi:hypothetical protein